MEYKNKIRKTPENIMNQLKLFKSRKYIAYFLIGLMLTSCFLNSEVIFSSKVVMLYLDKGNIQISKHEGKILVSGYNIKGNIVENVINEEDTIIIYQQNKEIPTNNLIYVTDVVANLKFEDLYVENDSFVICDNAEVKSQGTFFTSKNMVQKYNFKKLSKNGIGAEEITPEPNQETPLPEGTKEPSEEMEGTTPEPEQGTTSPEETKEPPKEEGEGESSPEPEKETVLPEETKEPSNEENGEEKPSLEPEQETVLPEETKEPSNEEEKPSPEPEQQTLLPVESQSPENSDKDDNIEETIDPSASPLETEMPEEKLKLEQEEVIQVVVPTDATIIIDPYNIAGNGQIYSTEIQVVNQNEFDIEVSLEYIDYYLETKTEIETEIVKECNLYLEREDMGFKYPLEKGMNENIDSFNLKNGDTTTYKFTGDVMQGTEYLWRENDIQINMKFSFKRVEDNIKN